MANRKDLSKVTDVSRAPSTVKKALIIYAEKEKVFEKQKLFSKDSTRSYCAQEKKLPCTLDNIILGKSVKKIFLAEEVTQCRERCFRNVALTSKPSLRLTTDSNRKLNSLFLLLMQWVTYTTQPNPKNNRKRTPS